MDDKLALQQIVDQLIGCESSGTLLERLEVILADFDALPARLHLADIEAGVYYPVYGFGCEVGESERDLLTTIAGDGCHLLRHHDEAVGMLQAEGPGGDDSGLSVASAVLGPALVAVQHQEGLVDELRSLHEQMGHLVSAGELLRLFDLEVLLVQVLQTAMRAVGAQVGAVLTPSADDSTVLGIDMTWGLREDHVAAIRLADGTPAGQHVYASGQVLRVTADAVDEVLDTSDLDAALDGLLVLPMTTADRKQGVVVLANPEASFTAESQRLASTVCDMAAMAIDNATMVEGMVERERLGRELAIARKVQADMFPEEALHLGDLHIDGAVRSCDETGGDYYTFLEHEGRALAMVADVTGHGLGAALFTTVAHAIVQQQLHSGSALLSALQVLNQGLAFTRSGRFMTAFLASLDPDSGRCTYFSAGHNPVLWVHNGEARWIESIGMPLGILPHYADLGGEQTIDLAPGDVLVLYTDGFIEAMNPDQQCFGEDRFAEVVLTCQRDGRQGQALIEELFREIDAWTAGAPPEDDLTLVLVARDP